MMKLELRISTVRSGSVGLKNREIGYRYNKTFGKLM